MAGLAEASVKASCSSKQCKFHGGGIESEHDRVEVKTYVPDKKSCETTDFQIRWSPTGEGMFHLECWNALFDPKRGLSNLERNMVKEASKTAEFHNSVSSMKNEAKRIADMIKKSSFAIAFTGAGISTSAGIGDFRGKSGKWTEQDRSKTYGPDAKPDKKKHFSYADLRPTYTHEALAKLVELGYIKHVISQNCDGLHSLSGIPIDKLWELHGNVFHERCDKCGTRQEWPHAVQPSRVGWAATQRCPNCRCYHYTGRKCPKPKCDGNMMKTVINFGDPLEDHVIDSAYANAKRNDFVLCLGTTLRVSPANALVEAGQEPIKLAICNRQPTPYDEMCWKKNADGQQYGSRVWGDCDPLMREIMMNILGQEHLEAWEKGRQDRLHHYDSKRVTTQQS